MLRLVFKMAIKRLQSLIEMDKNSGAEIGRNIGVTKKVISDWKLGRSEPDAEQLRRLAEYFKVSVAYVLGETEARQISWHAKSIFSASLK